MNTCQTLVNKDCTKRTIRKAIGTSSALTKLQSLSDVEYSENAPLQEHIQLGVSRIPENISRSTTIVALEFAGVKYKVEAEDGPDFLRKLESIGIVPITSQETCLCADKYAVHIQCKFSKEGYVKDSKKEMTVQQRKGEGEMAIADWLLWYSQTGQLPDGCDVAAVVSSGDTDAVVIMMFMVERSWPRLANGQFKNNVFVVWQKPNKLFDVYCITGLLKELEETFQTENIGLVTSVSLCIGGNDFITGFRSKSHYKVLTTVLQHQELRRNLLNVTPATVSLNREMFILLVKCLYASKSLDPTTTDYSIIRQQTIRAKESQKKSALGTLVKDPGTWLPPQSATERLAELLDFQIEYLLTAGNPSDPPLNLDNCNCLERRPSRAVAYNFGQEARVSDIGELVTVPITAESTTINVNRRK